MNKKDSLGDRMKNNYESRSKYLLPRRTYTLIRIDGKNFSQYTKNCDKPFDANLIRCMDATMKYLCENIQGARIGYCQSDEITLLLTDFDNVQSDAFFNGNVQKIASITASMATMAFNREVMNIHSPDPYGMKWATFDSRVWTIPDPIEVENCFIWRQQDATRNSIQMAAQAVCSHKELQGANVDQQQELMFQAAGVNWDKYSDREKRGACCIKRHYLGNGGVERSEWIVPTMLPIFTTVEGRDFLRSKIPVIERG